MRTIGMLLLQVGCSDGDDSNDGSDGGTDPTGGGADCVADDAAGTTWNDETGYTVPITMIETMISGDLDGRGTLYFIPENPRGLALAFEGGKVQNSGDGIKETSSLEWRPLWNELTQAGFGIALTEANPEDADGNDWDLNPNSNNDDLQHVLAFLDELVATTPLEPTTPLLLASFSGAGNFLNLFAPAAKDAGWDVRGATVHDGATWGWDNDFPTIWTVANNEWVDNDTVDENGPGAAFEAYEGHVDAGNLGLYLTTPEIPFAPSRMERNHEFSPEESIEVFDDLVGLAIIDEAGNRTFPIEEYDYWKERVWEDNATTPGPERVSPQLEVVWAVHRYNGVHALEECEFLLTNY